MNPTEISNNNATILANVPKVYEAGVADGKKAEYDAFWDVFQQNGTRTFYEHGFFHGAWTDEIFRPKYDIVIGSGNFGCAGMFRQSSITDIVASLEQCGVTVDFSATSRMDDVFRNINSVSVPKIDATNLQRFNDTFYNAAKLKAVEIVNISANCTFQNTFHYTSALTDVIITGTIGQTGLNFSWSPLSVASMKSIISCLADLTGTAGEGVYSIKFSSDCWAALEADSTAPDGNTWKDYINTLGWTT